MGVPDTPKLLRAPLLSLLLILCAAFPASAAAHHGGKPRHGGRAKHAARRPHPGRKHAARVHPRAKAPAPAPATKARERGERRASRRNAAAVATAATIADVLATPCQNTEGTPEAANLALAREAVLCLVNRERAEHSLAPLKTNAHLETAAEEHNAEMLQVDYFAHVAPDGETPVERIEKTGYIAGESEGYVIGENLAWGTYSLATPKAIVEAWIASPGHLANILESRYTETGIGIVSAVPASLGEGSPGATYAQEFGVIVE